MIAHYNGDASLEAQQIVIYRDLDLETDTATTTGDWETNWRSIAPDDCPVCVGTGTDQIKGNKANPCGGCFGLGKVREDGESPADRWELAEVGLRIITGLRNELSIAVRQLEAIHATPGVNDVLEEHLQAQLRQQEDAVAEKERQWREGPGHGPRGRRHTGD